MQVKLSETKKSWNLHQATNFSDSQQWKQVGGVCGVLILTHKATSTKPHLMHGQQGDIQQGDIQWGYTTGRYTMGIYNREIKMGIYNRDISVSNQHTYQHKLLILYHRVLIQQHHVGLRKMSAKYCRLSTHHHIPVIRFHSVPRQY